MRFYKQLFVVGLFVYFVQLLFAVVFYKERVVLPDDANYLFELVSNGGHFAIFHQRFIAVLTQWLPYSLIRLGLPLETVALSYSLNVHLFYFICYLICGLWVRNYKAALALLISGALFTTFTFYWFATELIQGISLFFVLFALLSHDEQARREIPVLHFVVIGCIILTVAFAHALMLFVMGYALIFLWIHLPKGRKQYLTAGGIYAAALVLKALFRDEYDSQALGGLRNFVRLFPNYFGTDSMRLFLKLCIGPYCWIPVILGMTVVHYVRQRDWLKLGLLSASCLGYLMLTTVSFPTAKANDFYQENLYLPLGIFLAIPLVYDILPRMKAAYGTAVIVILLGTSLLRIWLAHTPFTARLDWQRSLIGQHEGRKVILDERAFPKDTLMMSWSSPYEFWLLSTMEQKKTASILITPTPAKYTEMTDRRAFLPTFGLYYYSELPEPYFLFKDTANRYEWVNSEQ